MRQVYEMPSSNIKLWMDSRTTLISIRGETEEFSSMEIEDLIDTLVLLRSKRQDVLSENDNSFLQAKEKCKLCGNPEVELRQLAWHRLGKCVNSGASE